jgi:hypothetical protein
MRCLVPACVVLLLYAGGVPAALTNAALEF